MVTKLDAEQSQIMNEVKSVRNEIDQTNQDVQTKMEGMRQNINQILVALTNKSQNNQESKVEPQLLNGEELKEKTNEVEKDEPGEEPKQDDQ